MYARPFVRKKSILSDFPRSRYKPNRSTEQPYDNETKEITHHSVDISGQNLSLQIVTKLSDLRMNYACDKIYVIWRKYSNRQLMDEYSANS